MAPAAFQDQLENARRQRDAGLAGPLEDRSIQDRMLHRSLQINPIHLEPNIAVSTAGSSGDSPAVGQVVPLALYHDGVPFTAAPDVDPDADTDPEQGTCTDPLPLAKRQCLEALRIITRIAAQPTPDPLPAGEIDAEMDDAAVAVKNNVAEDVALESQIWSDDDHLPEGADLGAEGAEDNQIMIADVAVVADDNDESAEEEGDESSHSSSRSMPPLAPCSGSRESRA